MAPAALCLTVAPHRGPGLRAGDRRPVAV